jgi:hypothetical protein
VFFLRFHWIEIKFLVWSDQVYFSFYGRFRIKIFKKACLLGKEHFNLLILGSLPTGGFFVPHSVADPNFKKVQI